MYYELEHIPSPFFFQMIILSMHPLPRMNAMLDFICKTRSDRVFGRVLHVESKHRTSASFCFLSSIDIFPYVTQYSTCTRQNTLYFIILKLISIHTLVLEFHLWSIRKDSFHQAQLTHSVKPLATNLKVVGSSPTLTKTILFCIFLFSTLSLQVDQAHTNKIKNDIHLR